MNTIQNLLDKKCKLFPPSWLPDNIHYETIMGSLAYGVSNDDSDMDIYGFCIPPKNIVYPHLDGEIIGFGHQKERFNQYQEHHIKYGEKSYDVSIYNIVRYFHLCMENNPNMIDSLFTPLNCVKSFTAIGQKVRENRCSFLHKGSWHKFKGYAYSQLHKMDNKEKAENPKRQESIIKYGYDVKFAYHVVRLLNEVEQILTTGNIDLQQNNEQLKSIRRGEWKKEEIMNYFKEKELSLEKVYLESKLAYAPDEVKIKQLLLDCLEMHYGNLPKVETDSALIALQQIDEIIKKALNKENAQ